MFAGWTARTCPAAGPICQRSASTAGPSSLGRTRLSVSSPSEMPTGMPCRWNTCGSAAPKR